MTHIDINENNNDFKIKKFHKAQLNILKYVHSFCVKNDIEYFIIAGTLLGAIRHKGFIPWDLDIDIGMTRKNYDYLIESFNSSNNECFKLVYYGNDKDHYSPHAKIVMEDSEIIKKQMIDSHLKNHKGIFIDVFPLDYIPIKKKEQTKQERKIKRLRKIIYYKLSPIFSKGFLNIKMISKKILRTIMKIMPFAYLNRKLDKTMQRYSNTDKNFICSMSSGYSYEKQTMNINIYRPVRLIEFEGVKVYGPNNPNAYLKQLYGDYMKLPPKNKRFSEFSKIQSVRYPKWFDHIEKL